MDEQITDVEQTGLYDRRAVLRRGAIVVGAATLWTTPVVQSLGMRAAAAGSADDTGTGGSLCAPGSASSGQPRDLIFRWNGGSDASTALIVIQRPGSDRLCVVVGAGGLFQVANKAGSQWRVGIYDAAGAPSLSGVRTWKDLPSGGRLLDSSEIHTSCSEPLNLGDSFGTITLVAGTASGGDQRQQVLSGVSLSSVQVATTDCAVHTTAAESESGAEALETEELELEDVESVDVEAEGLKAEDVAADGDGVETAEVKTKKVEAPQGADDDSDGTDVGPSS
jgi:hypothetical protein